MYQFNTTTAQAASYEIGGWIWSSNYGWISLSAKNLTPNPVIDYGVKINGSNINSYGWSENVGWVCFGDTCQGVTPDGGSSSLNLDSATGKITGWAKVLSLGADGWIKVGRGDQILTAPAQNPPACYDCAANCEEASGTACLKYSSTTFDSCNTCFSTTRFDGQNLPAGTAEAAAGGSGNIIEVCGSIGSGDCVKKTSGNASRVECSTDCGPSEQFGVNQDQNNGGLLGWGWNGDASGKTGAGWINFNPPYGQGFIVYPWIQTSYGSIYTPGTVRQKSGSQTANATYCIYASDVLNISSAQCETSVVGGVAINFPSTRGQTANVYQNALGKIDVEGLITLVRGDYNKYGQKVVSTSEADASSMKLLPANGILDNTIYYFKNGLQHSKFNYTIKNASAGKRGNGLIIVDGNTWINTDIYYESAMPAGNDLGKLASLGWIIRGNVIVKDNVTSTVGAFVLLGKKDVDCVKTVTGDYPQYDSNYQCGVFFDSESNNPLTVYGLIVAKAFDFRRTYATLGQGSERIIYDGRIKVNPPPGMEGFVEGLPVTRDSGLQ